MLHLKNISFAYNNQPIVDGVDLHIAPNSFNIILGRSGCGKSTLLRLIAGLEKPTQGSIKWAKNKPKLAYLFQDYDAYPWLNVFDNVRQGSGPAPYPKDKAIERILNDVGLWDARHKYPSELSGGMRKRLGLARCLVRRPEVLLLDEPFSALDMSLRDDMYALIQKMVADTGCTVIMISHDLHEALLLADRLLVCSPRPAKIMADIANTLPHPRGEDIVATAFYRQTHTQILGLLKQGLDS